MNPLTITSALVAALIHVWFFVLESLGFERESVWRRFGLRDAAEARIVRSFAYNQGFYNLFLAAGVVIGLGLVLGGGNASAGRAIVLFACGSMVGAGLVLVLHDRRFARAAALQIAPPLVAILGIWLLA